jgi:hypothetical protein
MEPGCTCTYSGESLRRNDLYYISRLHDNVLRHIFISQNAAHVFFTFQIFAPIGYATICTNASSRLVLTCKHLATWMHRRTPVYQSSYSIRCQRCAFYIHKSLQLRACSSAINPQIVETRKAGTLGLQTTLAPRKVVIQQREESWYYSRYMGVWRGV